MKLDIKSVKLTNLAFEIYNVASVFFFITINLLAYNAPPISKQNCELYWLKGSHVFSSEFYVFLSSVQSIEDSDDGPVFSSEFYVFLSSVQSIEDSDDDLQQRLDEMDAEIARDEERYRKRKLSQDQK